MKRWLLLATLALNGCITHQEVTNWFTPEKVIEVGDVRRSQQCGTANAAAALTVFPNLAAVQAWEQSRHITLTPGEPELPKGPYAVVEVGKRGTAGYGVAVSRHAGRRGEALTLKGTFIAPPPGKDLPLADTAPCVLVALPPRNYTAVEIIDQSGEVRASSLDSSP